MNSTPERLIAVDWSGAVAPSAQKKSIWIADWHDGELRDFASGSSREKTIAYIELAVRETPRLAVGFDFAFSYPAWFLKELRCSKALEFWLLVAEGKGEQWLSEPSAYFWGRSKRPLSGAPHGAFRATELGMKKAMGGKAQPKSGFQINGAGSVGTGSLRGIPYLARLHQAGFSIWPFDLPGLPMVVEIYPRIFTGDTVTSRCSARAAHLDRPQYTDLSANVRNKALDSEHAFDALCSVVGMQAHASEFSRLQQSTDPDELLEGRIWRPAGVGDLQ